MLIILHKYIKLVFIFCINLQYVTILFDFFKKLFAERG